MGSTLWRAEVMKLPVLCELLAFLIQLGLEFERATVDPEWEGFWHGNSSKICDVDRSVP